VAQCLERLQRPWEAVRSAYLDCIAQHPGRAEPLVHLAELERRRGHYSVAYGLAARAAGVPMPGRDALFVQRQAYEFRALDEKAIAAFYLGRYQESFDINAGLLQAASLPEGERKRIEVNRDNCVPYLAEIRLARDDTRIESLGRAGAESGEVTLTITSSKRPELFVKTVNSFVNCCTDVERIGRWICVDDNSSAEDRREMQRLFPFFEFIWKGPEQKGHARSMNLILDAVTTPYWLHLEDDWQFFEALPYVTLALEILEEDRGLGQVLFNRHDAESLEDRGLPGGVIRRTATGRRFLEHLHLAPGTPEYDEFVCAHAGSLSNVYWPHYSLRPALLRMSAIRAVGPYDEDSTHFELEFANRYQQRGFRSAFLDTICSLHIGRRTTERSSAAEPNAYELNEEPQFDEPPIRVQLLANWCSSEDVCREWERMSQGGGRWGRIQVTASPDDIDYHAVINAPPPGAQIAPERTIVFHMAPAEGIERLPGEWSAPDPAKFFQISFPMYRSGIWARPGVSCIVRRLKKAACCRRLRRPCTARRDIASGWISSITCRPTASISMPLAKPMNGYSNTIAALCRDFRRKPGCFPIATPLRPRITPSATTSPKNSSMPSSRGACAFTGAARMSPITSMGALSLRSTWMISRRRRRPFAARWKPTSGRAGLTSSAKKSAGYWIICSSSRHWNAS
jgi:hypothetical protein